MKIAQEVALRGLAALGRAVQVQQAGQNVATGRLRASLGVICAGGPGSGRHPGFGEGKKPGSGRPFGVHPGIHKVLTEHGYEHTGATKMAGKSPVIVHYQHEDGVHSAFVNSGTQKWTAKEKIGTAQVPNVPGGLPLVRDKMGEGPTALKEHLEYAHQTPSADKSVAGQPEHVLKQGGWKPSSTQGDRTIYQHPEQPGHEIHVAQKSGGWRHYAGDEALGSGATGEKLSQHLGLDQQQNVRPGQNVKPGVKASRRKK